MSAAADNAQEVASAHATGESKQPPADQDGQKKDSGEDAGKDKQPEGGYDSRPVPVTDGPTYTVKFTFHRARNLPVADLSDLSADPYVLVQLDTGLPTRHRQDPPLQFRSRTQHKSLNPDWNDEWIVAGVPQKGATLRISIMDEDVTDADEQLGNVDVDLDFGSGWRDIKEGSYGISKLKANKRPNLMRFFYATTHPFDQARKHTKNERHEELVVSVQVLGKTKKDDECGKAYTVGPLQWRQHYSPMIGRITHTRDPKNEDRKAKEVGEGNGPSAAEASGSGSGSGEINGAGTQTDGDSNGKGKKKDAGGVERYDFQASEIQLQGPVPNELYHRFVDFKPFVHGMFEATGLRGRILNKAERTQHRRVYNHNHQTQLGYLPSPPNEETSRKFLELVHHDQGGRKYTYVITLDGLFRFTETGKEFGIDLLSKHTMHSDVALYIAWSGEFLIRRLAHPGAEEDGTHPPHHIQGGPPSEDPPQDPKHYELIIDNDSGTYRPNADLIPIYQKWLEKQFPGLKIRVMNCADKELDKIKEEQDKIKKREGERKTLVQHGHRGSISSSDVSSLESQEARQEEEKEHKSKFEKGIEIVEDPIQAIKKALPGDHGSAS